MKYCAKCKQSLSPEEPCHKTVYGMYICIDCYNSSSTIQAEVDEPKEAIRYDSEKLRMELIPGSALREIAAVYTFGAKKYGDYNWMKGMAWSRCMGSCLRHLYAWWGGEIADKESGCHHLAHAIWNLITLFEYATNGLGTDNRIPKP